jgi:hypothetical protein
VHGDALDAATARHLQRALIVMMDGVDAAGADEADEMKCTVATPYAPAQFHQLRDLIKLPGVDGVGDADQVLRHHTARSEVQMTYLAVADLTLRQSDRLARGMQQRERMTGHQAVPHRGVTERDCVPFSLLAIAPAV